jgi:hypothetical protein
VATALLGKGALPDEHPLSPGGVPPLQHPCWAG